VSAQAGDKRRELRVAERWLRVSFLLNTFLWTSKEKYSVFADGTAIQCDIAAGDSLGKALDNALEVIPANAGIQ
jgi:hypothetical protein